MFLNRQAVTVYLLTVTIFCGCKKGNSGAITVAFYNCENFFDTIHNPLKEDEEFTPGGKYHYTSRIYEQKVHNIATVVQSMGGADGPAILGLAEVENINVLKDLVSQPELVRRKYKYELYEGPDPRGITVALVYNPEDFRVLTSEALHVDLSGVSGKSLTRDVLHVYGILEGDTVDVFVNHWPSRRGGGEEREGKREMAARVVKGAVDRAISERRGAKVIVMGDFNDNPTDSSIAEILGATGIDGKVSEKGLYDPWVTVYKNGGGTEAYHHAWNLFDHIIISGAFVENKGRGLHYLRPEIFKPDFIVDHYKGHEGEPHRSFVGTHWINGYSDHFPVLIHLEKGE